MANQVGLVTNLISYDRLLTGFFIVDTLKGSYYANPVIDEPDVSPELRKAHPEYYGKNICETRNLLYS